MVANLWQDLRYGARSLRKNPGFALVAVITLALGIGANTATFSVVNAVLLRQVPFKNPDQVMWVWSSRTDRENAPFSLPDFLDYRDQNQTLEQIAAFSNIGISLSGAERTERLQGLRVSANLFQLLGVDAGAGRTLLTDDDEPGNRHVVVLTYESWQRRFGGDPQMIGKILNLNGEGYQLVGILPRRFDLPVREAEMAIPLLLAATGIYGIVSYTVTQRAPEIGIRLALGAGRTNVFRLILGQGLKVVLLGLALGLVVAVAMTRVIRSLLFGVTPNDALTFVVVSLLLVLVALIACSLPARRATKVDPLIAMRNE